MMSLDDLAKTISKFAPILGAAIPLPGAAAIGSLVGAAFGGSTANVEDLVSKINMSEDAKIKLVQIENDYSIQLQKIIADKYVSEVNAEVEDRKDARNLNIQTKTSVPAVLTYMLLIGFFFIIYALFHCVIPAENEPTVYTLVGSYNGLLLSCGAYWLGSSFTSQKKDTMIYNSTPLDTKK